VTAAVEGFFAGGATEVVVNDGHGAGYTIAVEDLDPRAEVIHGRERPFWLPYLDATCHATALVGGHAKAGTVGACLCHTMSLEIRDWSINGVSLGEMGLQALIAGYYGVPFIFCSGDAYACREIEQLIPGCQTAAVKEGMSRFSAKALSPVRAHAAIREGARRAMSLIGRIKPLDLGRPLRFVDQRNQVAFDPAKPPAHSRVIDGFTREILADDVMDLMCKIYGYDRNWKPFSAVKA
jgi:D-amino peptidase